VVTWTKEKPGYRTSFYVNIFVSLFINSSKFICIPATFIIVGGIRIQK
jgi:hypothetical protein